VRVLGSTNEHSLVNDRLWVFTGNNMTIGGDLGRRMVWIDIDPQVEKPELRTGFDIPDLPGYVTVNRGRILYALLTWIAAWDAAGRPNDEATSDSYGRWIATVRRILQIAGVPGTFAAPNAEREAVANTDEAEWGQFLAAVHDVYGNSRWTTKDLTDRMDRAWASSFTPPPISDGGRIQDALPDELAARADRTNVKTIKKSLGKWLGNRKGQWHNGYTARDAGQESGTKSTYWQVFHMDDPAYQELRRQRGERHGSS
jgi:hypothetical protein